MIEVKGLTKNYGSNVAISGLNFKIEAGDTVGLLGPNGAGKSTAMKIITGFLAPTSGSVSIDGADIFKEALQIKKKIGYLPENPPLYMDMRVREYLAYICELKDVNKQDLSGNIDSVLDKVNITDVQNRLIGNLSKGYKQRVGIAGALVSDPEILILDEPTIGLDPNQIRDIRDLIKSTKANHQTLILSTHILPEVQETCDKIIIINKGNIVAQGSLDDLSGMMAGHRGVTVKTKRPVVDFKDKLTSIDGLSNFRKVNDTEFCVDIAQDDSVQEKLASLVVQSGVGLLEFSSSKVSLEDVFTKHTTTQASDKNSGEK